jgi:hypothetical protein
MCRDVGNGPDWMDVRSALKSMEEAHECSCTLTLLPCGKPEGSEWYVVVTATDKDPLRLQERAPVVVQVQWPNVAHKNLSSAAYDALYKLDFACSKKWWVQQTIPF